MQKPVAGAAGVQSISTSTDDGRITRGVHCRARHLGVVSGDVPVRGGRAKTATRDDRLLKIDGDDVILVETVGVGQSEVTVADMVDTLFLTSARTGGSIAGGQRGGARTRRHRRRRHGRR